MYFENAPAIEPPQCGGGVSIPCLEVTLTDVGPGPVDGAREAATEAGAPSDGGLVRCCPRDMDPQSITSLDAGSDGWRCAALGGTDLGGCYKTCAWACPDTHVVARVGRDAHGCDAWVPEADAGATGPFCLPYRRGAGKRTPRSW